jgi:hypothetical protein
LYLGGKLRLRIDKLGHHISKIANPSHTRFLVLCQCSYTLAQVIEEQRLLLTEALEGGLELNQSIGCWLSISF